MSSKSLITEAIATFPLVSSPAWAALTANDRSAVLDRIEPVTRSISTVDNLFDGVARIVLQGSRVVEARVFGRFSERRAEVDRIVIAA